VIIVACEQPSDQDYEEGLKKHQMVLEFDMATWKVTNWQCLLLFVLLPFIVQRAIEVFDIKESQIPQRPPAEKNIGNQWYG